MKRCEICGIDLTGDLFASVAQKPVCAICAVKYVGGNPTPNAIAAVRALLGLRTGEYLVQDHALEAARILERS